MNEFRVQAENNLGAEFCVRDGAVWICIEGSGYEGDYGASFKMSVEDAKALLLFLQKELQA